MPAPDSLTDMLEPSWPMKRCVRAVVAQIALTALAAIGLFAFLKALPDQFDWMRGFLIVVFGIHVVISTWKVRFLLDEYRTAKRRRDYFAVFASPRRDDNFRDIY